MLELEPWVEVVGEAARADLALRELDYLGVDLILMDVAMPGMDGIEATRAIKAKREDLPIVLLTGHGDDYLADALCAGASGYILKSCTREDLLEAISKIQQGEAAVDPTVVSTLFRSAAELATADRESLLTQAPGRDILKLAANGVDSGL